VDDADIDRLIAARLDSTKEDIALLLAVADEILANTDADGPVTRQRMFALANELSEQMILGATTRAAAARAIVRACLAQRQVPVINDGTP
jgi:hypothetical protein